MKTIILKSLSIRNFKGIKELDIDFDQAATTISGENGTGKTTVFDALTWLLFGKDSMDKKDFSIKPLDKNNRPLEKVDNEVSAVLIEDGSEITLKRIHREKWTKKRGALEAEFTGNETLHYYNEVPQNSAQFKVKIDAILDEGVFKLVTSPKYFNSLHWEKRREVLSLMAGEISDEIIIQQITDSEHGGTVNLLATALNSGKTLEEYRREIASKKKLIKDDLQDIPTRIDEIHRNLPEAINTTSTEKNIKALQGEIDKLDGQIADAGKGMEEQDKALLKLRDDLRAKQTRDREIVNQTETSLNAGAQEIQNKRILLEGKIKHMTSFELENIQNNITIAEKTLGEDQVWIGNLREDWSNINAEKIEFTAEEFCCPTCKRDFEAEDIAAEKVVMIEQFNSEKTEQLAANMEKGKQVKEKIEQAQIQIKLYGEQVQEKKLAISELQDELNKIPEAKTVDVNVKLAENTEYLELYKEIKELVKKIDTPRQPLDISIQQEKKREITIEIDSLKDSISSQGVREKSTARMSELKEDEQNLAQELADLENIEYIILEFTKARTDLIESRINGKFKYVTFKMFEQQINGGEVPVCTTLIDGVPFSDANTAGQINAGLDIINALSGHYEVTAPIFVDHKESVNTLLDTPSQLINLAVSKEKVLTIK